MLARDGIAIRGIYERSDSKIRLKEGMERFKGFIGEPFDPKVEIEENGVRYLVNVADGQKTASSWIRNTTGRRLPDCAPGKRCWTALPIPAPSP